MKSMCTKLGLATLVVAGCSIAFANTQLQAIEKSKVLAKGIHVVIAEDSRQIGLNFHGPTGYGVEFDAAAAGSLSLQLDETKLDSFIQSQLDLVNREILTAGAEVSANGRIALDDVNAQIDLDTEQTKVVFAIPLGRAHTSFFYFGLKKKVDTLYLSVDASPVCRGSVQGSVSVNGDTVSSGAATLQNCQQISKDIPEKVSASTRKSWNYTVAVLGYGYVGENTTFQILIDTQPLEVIQSQRVSLESELMGHFSDLYIKGTTCTKKKSLCAGGEVELLTFAGLPSQAFANAFLVTDIGKGRKLKKEVSAEYYGNQAHVEGSLSLFFGEPSRVFQVEIGRRKYFWLAPKSQRTTVGNSVSGSLNESAGPLSVTGQGNAGYTYSFDQLKANGASDTQDFIGLHVHRRNNKYGARIYEDGYSLHYSSTFGRKKRNEFRFVAEDIDLESNGNRQNNGRLRFELNYRF